MKHLKKKEISILKDRLNEVRNEILGDVRNTMSHRKDSGDDGIQDIADQAADSYFKQVLMDLGERERGRFKEVQDAFERMENGTYGICEETEDEIPFKRLIALPYARYTVEAQNEMERKRLR